MNTAYSRLDHPRSFRHFSPAFRFLVSFGLVYLTIWIICPFVFHRDPSSVFFSKSTAYDLRYSAQRQRESARYIRSLLIAPSPPKATTSETPAICVGIASVARHGANYLNDAVGSLLSGLSDSERRRVHLVLLVAHTDPSLHPAVPQGWIPRVADTILTYQNLSRYQFDRIRVLEAQRGSFVEKTIIDYTYLLETCQNTGAEHVAILEDDVLAMDGWFHRTLSALDTAQKQTKARSRKQYFYLRLFWTEKFLGWNSESWFKYLFYSVVSTAVVFGITLSACRKYPFLNPPSTSRFTADRTILFYTVMYMALIISLFFSIGPIWLFPMRNGVNEMSNFGCCSQGLVFPQDRVPEIITFLRANPGSPVDSLLETYADKYHELRWAVVPSVLQHVGSRSSKAGRDTANTIFNFAFEDNNLELLKIEHMRALESGP